MYCVCNTFLCRCSFVGGALVARAGDRPHPRTANGGWARVGRIFQGAFPFSSLSEDGPILRDFRARRRRVCSLCVLRCCANFVCCATVPRARHRLRTQHHMRARLTFDAVRCTLRAERCMSCVVYMSDQHARLQGATSVRPEASYARRTRTSWKWRRGLI